MTRKSPTSIFPSSSELTNHERLQSLFRSSSLGDERIDNLGLYMTRQQLMRIFFFQELYSKIINVHGTILEFGCRWGTNLAIMTALRGIYEPYNHNRKIVGFDTFTGLTEIGDFDKQSDHIREGAYHTTKDYDAELRQILNCLENECPIPHIRKHEIIKGDVRNTITQYLAVNPQTVIAMAYFDMDIYEPTKIALEAIMPFVTKGTVLGFDEMNWDVCPGPTRALDEVIGLRHCRVMRSPLQPIPGYVVIE